MKTKRTSRNIVCRQRLWLLSAAALGAAVAPHASAQSMLAPPPEFSITPPAVQQYQQAQNEQMQVFEPLSIIPRRTDEPFLTWGPLGIRPHAFYRFLWGDGLATAGSNHVSTIVQEFSPGLLLSLGTHWSLDYTPTWRMYSSKAFRDTLDQNVRFTGGAQYEDWNFGLSQGYSLVSAPMVETGTQTDVETFSTGLNGTYRFNSKMWADLTLNQNIVTAENFNSYREWSTVDWLNHQFWPRLNGGIGLSVGFVDGEGGSDMMYERVQARTEWRATDKVSLHVEAGVEDRQFLGGRQGNLVNPVAGAGLQYEPFEQTRLSLTVDRTVATSYFEGQATETTGLHANLNQRLLGVLYLDLGGGYNRVDYVNSGATSTGRSDNYYTFNARLSCTFLKRGRASVFYQYSDNSSSVGALSFASNQAGFELGFHY